MTQEPSQSTTGDIISSAWHCLGSLHLLVALCSTDVNDTHLSTQSMLVPFHGAKNQQSLGTTCPQQEVVVA
jgi:hypothetical protein